MAAAAGSPPAWQYSRALQGYYYIDDRGGRPRTLVTSDGRQYPVNGSVLRTVEEVTNPSFATGSPALASRLDAARGYRATPGPAQAQSSQAGVAARHPTLAIDSASIAAQRTTPGTSRSQHAASHKSLGASDHAPFSAPPRSAFQIAPPRALIQSRLLDEDFKVRQQPRDYFIPGKVFMVLWAEPARANSKKSDSGESTDSVILEGRNRELVFSKVRRFIVIRAGETHCSALPIVTHASPASHAREHGIVLTGDQPPEAALSALNVLPQAVRVIPDASSDRLDPISRINYGTVYTIEHSLKVKNFGQADDASIVALLRQFRQVFTARLGPARGSSTNTGQRSVQMRSDATHTQVRPAIQSRTSTRSTHDLGSLTKSVSGLNLTRRDSDDQSDSEDEVSDDEAESGSDDGVSAHETSQSTPDLRSSLNVQGDGSRSKSSVNAFETAIDALQRTGYTRREALNLLRQAVHTRSNN